MENKMLEELIEIRKELQDIRSILESEEYSLIEEIKRILTAQEVRTQKRLGLRTLIGDEVIAGKRI